MTHDELLANINSEEFIYSRTLEVPYAALRAVVEFHSPMKNSDMDESANDNIGCSGCGYDFEYSRWSSVYPCLTIKSIERELQ